MVWIRLGCATLLLGVLSLLNFALRDGRAAVLELQSQQALEQNAYPRAAEALEAALRLQPGNAELWLSRAELERRRWFLRGEQASRARTFESFERAAALSPSWAKPLDQRSQLEVLLGDYPAALRSVEEAIRRDPNSGSLRELQAKYLEQANRIPEAIAAYREVLRLRSSAGAEAALRRLGVNP